MPPLPPITLDPDLARRGVGVVLGCVRARVTVGVADEALATALDATAEARAAELADTAPGSLPAVAAARRAYKALGKDPARYRPAAEALLRRVKSGKGLWRVNAVVDVNNLLSLETGISIGAYDMAAVAGPIILRRAGEGESYAGIGRGPLNLEGLPVLADAAGPFGCPTSDSERTMVSEATTDLLMVLYGFDGTPGLDAALARAADLLARHAPTMEGAADVAMGRVGDA